MNTLSPHITLSAVARRFSLVWLMLLLGTLSIFAQSASDFSVTVVSTPSTCVQNGQVEIKVSKVPGAPTNYTYKAYYDLLNSKGTSVTTTQGYVANNVVANLYPGTYTALVRIEIQETGLKIDLPAKTTTVTSTYKNPTVKVREVRKSLNNYRPNGSSTPVPTGILSVTVLDGNGPYTLTIEAAPTAYKGKKEFSLEEGKELFFYEVPSGQYRLKVTDACGDAPVQTIEMTNVRRDLLNANISSSNLPFRSWLRMTSDMRLNQCGWLRLDYEGTRSSMVEPDLKPYWDNRDTLARYYEYAWQTWSDWKASKPRVYHEFQKTAPFGTTDYGSDENAIYYKLPDGVTYQMMGQQSSLYHPLAFIRVKGSSEELPRGYSATNYGWNSLDVDYKRASDPCSPTYVLQVRPRNDHDVLLCLPITVRVVSKTNPNDKQEITLTEDISSYTDFPIPLKYSENYTLTTIAGNGQTKTETIEAITWKYEFYNGNVSDDHCMGIRKYIPWIRRLPFSTSFAGYKIRFVSAPADFTPEEGALAVEEEYTIPENMTGTNVYPFSPKAKINSSIYYYLPVGEYRFELTDPCGTKYDVRLTINSNKVPRYAGDISRFAPRTVKEECGRVRIYPFAGGSEGILTRDGVSTQPYLRITKIPKGVSYKDIRSNISDDYSEWRDYKIFTSSYKEIADPKSIYIDFPATDGSIELTLYYSKSSSSSLKCLPTTQLSLENPPLTFERDSYIGYSCPSGTSGLLHIVPVNCVGDATIEIYDTETGELKYSYTNVDKTAGITQELKGTAENPVPSSYRIKITDQQCDNTSEEVIAIYSLASPSAIRSKEQQRKFCVGDRIELEVINLGDKVYTWTLPNGEQRTGRKLVIDQAELEHTGTYTVSVAAVKCDGAETKITLTTEISVSPRELWWRQDAADQNWNNPNNWSQADGKPIQAVPTSCTDVHIPAQVDKGYPDLSAQSTLRDPFGDPVCSDIYFHYGAQLGSPQLLTYERAFVDYNFGKMSNGGTIVAHQQTGHTTADSKLLARDRWYMVATPLNNMVSGDFSLAGYPKTYQRYFVASQTPSSATDVAFTQPFNTMTQTFAPTAYYHGFALKVAGWESGRKGYDDHKYLNQINGIIRIPFFADASRATAYPLHSYDAAAGVSTFRYYNEETLAPLAYTEQANRGKGVYPYRFVYERYNAEKPTSSQIATITDGGVTMQGYALPISGVAAGSYIMVGNPFMTPIDFDKLWEFNKDVIYPYYYVFEDNQWRVYSLEASIASTRGKTIAPLQAVLLRSKSGSSSQLRFPTSGDKSVLLASWSLGRGDLASVQSAERPYKSASLPIHLQMGHGSDAPLASAYVMWDAEGDNVPALGNNEYSESPLVYVVDADCGEGEMVLYPKRETGRLDIGVRASYASEMVLDFSDMDRSLYEYMTLTDRKSGREQDLLRQPQYRFVHELGVADPRFTLQLKRYGVPTAVEEPAHDFVTPEISIHAVEERCIVQA
ncbi:hypothetical protein, partial [uncultured Porphyromonas sp.]|uniref:hypothetical protein n=1 Tax=uncultured Porphyromonas sp. TaxID=159274 RepID=UPI0025DBE032